MKQVIELTHSTSVKEILEEEVKSFRCEDLTLDEVFGLTPIIHEKYCCTEVEENSLLEQESTNGMVCSSF